jgi:hypothetical protein
MLSTSEMLEQIKSSNFFKFIEKVCSKKANFTTSNINNQQNTIIMCTYNLNDTQRKGIVYQMALILLSAIGKTTNKEIKDAVHNVLPGVFLTQKQVSDIMNELTNEKTDWTRDNTTTSGGWWEYTPAVNVSPATQTTPQPASLTAPATSTTTAVPSVVANLVAANKDSAGKVVSLGKIGLHPVPFLKKLDPQVKVAFAAGFEPLLTNTVDKYEARRIYKLLVPDALFNDVRMISVKTFLKRNNLVD